MQQLWKQEAWESWQGNDPQVDMVWGVVIPNSLRAGTEANTCHRELSLTVEGNFAIQLFEHLTPSLNILHHRFASTFLSASLPKHLLAEKMFSGILQLLLPLLSNLSPHLVSFAVLIATHIYTSAGLSTWLQNNCYIIILYKYGKNNWHIWKPWRGMSCSHLVYTRALLLPRILKQL